MSGRLAPSLSLNANDRTAVYKVVIPKSAKVSFNILNPTQTDAAIKVWVSPLDIPVDGQKIEDLVLTAGGSILERTDLGFSRDETLFVESSVEGVTVRVWGEEKL